MFALIAMSALLGASSFGFGMLPLSFVLTKSHLTRLSSLGTGLLLGTALGVIIPEGIETLAAANPTALPTSRIALSLLIGFTFMLIVEQVVSPHSHSHSLDLPLHTVKQNQATTALSEVEFDAELGELENEQGVGRPGYIQVVLPTPPASADESRGGGRERAYPLTVGLVMHALADGLALGVSFFSGSETSHGATSSLSIIVFLALIIHKAPTALALASSLLATSLPREECKRHLAIFSASTPIAAVVSYAFVAFFGVSNEEEWTGTALLISGGTFVYVATVLQPVSSESSHTSDVSNVSRVSLIVIGIFVPFGLGVIFGLH